MKRAIKVIIPTLILIIRFASPGNTQCSTSVCTTAPEPVSCPADACIMCDPCLLNGYLGQTLPESNPCNEPASFCGSIENNQWFAFIAPPSGSVTFHFEILNCTGTIGGGGMQAQIFSTGDCDLFSPVSPCWNPGYATNGSLKAENLQPFCTYFLMIDGWGGDICEFRISTTDCNEGPAGLPVVTGPAQPCLGEIAEYSVSLDPNTGCTSTNDTYSWNGIFPFGEIIGPANGPTVSVKWNQPGTAFISATITNECYGTKESSPVEVSIDSFPVSMISLTACEGECIPCAGQMICEPGLTQIRLASWRGCDSLVNCFLAITPPIVHDLGQVVICGEGTYKLCGESLDACGNYTVTCESWQGCDSTVLVDLIFLNPKSVIATPDTLSCTTNEPVKLDGSGSSKACSGTVVCMYSWAGPPGGIMGSNDETTVKAVLPGEYCLTLTHSVGGYSCSDVTCVTVAVANEIPVLPQIDGPSQACAGDTIAFSVLSLGNHVASYQWYPTGGNILRNDDNKVILKWDSTGMNQVCLTATDFCSRSVTSCNQINIHQLPTANAGPDALLDCMVSEVKLGGNYTPDGMILNWAGGGLANPMETNPTVSEPGTYILTVTDPLTNCMAFDSVLVTQIATRPLPYFSVIEPTCSGKADGHIEVDNVQNGQPPFLYAINGGPFSQQSYFNDLAPGEYTVAIEDANGCRHNQKVVVNEPGRLGLALTLENVGENNTILWGDSVRVIVTSFKDLDTSYALVWSPAGTAPCNGCKSFWAHPTQTSTYTVRVNKNGCTEEASTTVFVKKERKIYVPNAFSPNGDGTNDTFYIQSGPHVEIIKSFVVYDRWGSRVFEKFDFQPNYPSLGWDGSFRAKPFDSGVFIWKATVRFIDGETGHFNGLVSLYR